MSRNDYNRMCKLLRKQKRGPGLTSSEAEELWELKQAVHEDNKQYLEAG